MKITVLFVFVIISTLCIAPAHGQNYYFSLDIGSDLEMDDPITPGLIDPGCIYAAPYLIGVGPIKYDEQIFNGTPPPPPPAVTYPGSIADYTNYFDMDGEDQLSELLIIEEPQLIETNASMVSCLWKNPHVLYLSYDDDGAPGWPVSDIPVLVPPTYGQLAPYDEIFSGTVWRAWSLTGAADEDALGLANDPVAGDDTFDDDVDALDVELCDWWYWTCDHEACGDGQGLALDPGMIYVTSMTVPGYMPAIPQYVLGLTNNPATPILEDADVDAFEFCTTDDTNILQFFTGTQPGREYLAVLFSVDQDDLLTPTVDESGGLMPNTIYISLLNGEAPVVLNEYDDDIDALAVYGTEDQEDQYDFGDAPDPTYPTLLASTGAQHKIVSSVFMGTLIDAEADGQPNASATLDDLTNLKDEDGVTFTSPLTVGQSANLDVVASTNGTLTAWIDFNHDGSWGTSGDAIFGGQALTTGINHLTFAIPASASATNTFARFRFTTNLVSLTYTGLEDNGEVEDYEVELFPPEDITTTNCPKWIQPPDCDAGLNLLSGYSFAGYVIPVVADDWWCDGRPIVGITWWGSYYDYASSIGTPLAPTDNLRPASFRLTWYTDIPASAQTNFSQPGTTLAVNMYNLAAYGITNTGTGLVSEKYYCTTEYSFETPGLYEHEYEYTLRFPQEHEWLEKEGQIYWLLIEAIYTNSMELPPNLWGWKTTDPFYGWNDAAVYAPTAGGTWTNMIFPPPGWTWMTNHPHSEKNVDMAFTLLTDVCPARCKKFEAPPNMLTGEDMHSYTSRLENMNVVRAADFISDGRPITDIHWWGSYIGWQDAVPGTLETPVPPPTGVDRVEGFNLSWHLQDDVIDCMPGTLLTNIFVSVSNCHEVFYGSVFQEWKGAVYEHEYQYYVDLLDPDISGAGAWLETNTGHYWLNIQAVMATNWNVGDSPHQGWGWKITEAIQDCPSVLSSNGGLSWTMAFLPDIHPFGPIPFDLAFELTTPEPPWKTSQYVHVVFTNQYTTPPAWHTMVTTGHCGCGKQVLQESTNLLNGAGWIDIATNAYPRPLNTWRAAPLATQRFYRIRQTP